MTPASLAAILLSSAIATALAHRADSRRRWAEVLDGIAALDWRPV